MDRYVTSLLLWLEQSGTKNNHYSLIGHSVFPSIFYNSFEMSEQNLHCVLIWLWQLFDQVLHSRDTLSWLLFWKKKKKKRVESLHETESRDRVFWNLVFGDTQ